MKVDICGVPFKIEEFDNSRRDEIDQMGRIELKKGTIYLSSELPPEVRKQTLIHEWLHGVLDNYGFYEESQKEPLVNALAIELYRNGYSPKVKE